MLIKLHEVAGNAYFNMLPRPQHEEGIKFAFANLPVNYNGTKKECIQYLLDKIKIATDNAITNNMYLGCIALYNAMIKELLTV